ncbi:MAG: beta-lactamase family protein [Planctomycetes bacterium]|nr:beta-lactamase family protein [Planctomycetota bacterium]
MAGRKIARTALALGVALSGISCARSTECLVFDLGPGVERLRGGGSVRAEADRLVQPLIDSGEVKGMVVEVLGPDGRAETFGYGCSGSPGASGPPDGQTVFQLGSVTKVFVAALFAVLVEEGRLREEETVREILPPEVALSKDAGAITLRELITHTSGLPREPLSFAALSDVVDYMFTGRNLYSYLTRDVALQYLATCKLPPREERVVDYSNLGTALLAWLMEVKTGRPLAELVREKVTGPLGLGDTTFDLEGEEARRLAAGHSGGHPCFQQSGTEMPAWEMGEFMRGTGGLFSTADDLMALARANLGGGRDGIGPLLASMQHVRCHGQGEDVALGWIVNHFDDQGVTIVYKYGIVSGYSAYVGMIVEEGLAVVVMSNSFNWHDKVGHNLLLRLSGMSKR